MCKHCHPGDRPSMLSVSKKLSLVDRNSGRFPKLNLSLWTDLADGPIKWLSACLLDANCLSLHPTSTASRSHGETLKWTTAVVPAMEKGMTLDEKNNVLVVPSSGLYFVYSQLLFHKDSCPTDVPLLLTHTISILKSKEFLTDEVPLLKSIKSVCEGETSSPNRMWFESIYQGAIFQLTRGDRLTSKTAETQYLDFTREGQLYFGAIALE